MTSSTAIADVIVVAAGSSQRMGGIDKLAWTVGARPLVAWTLDAITAAPGVDAIVVVTAPSRRDAIADAPWLPSTVRAVVAGGERRQDSVRAGFEALEAIEPGGGDRVVLIHDGARPVVTPSLVAAVIGAAATHGAAIPVLPIAETVKRLDGDRIAGTIDREALAVAQTPQGFRRGLLRDALASDEAAGATWTDEAALMEACRIPVHVVPGDPGNLKVTVPADLARVATSLVPDTGDRRTGIGHDTHGFGPGEPLWLGGVEFPGVPRLVGHSDGDVVLHAIADAVLGAAGLGDLGRIYPAGPATPEGIASAEMLIAVVGRLAAAGWRPATVDLTIAAARPRLAARLDEIRERVAELLGIDASAVSVKASTGNLDGSEGAGRAISTIALATIEPAR